MNQVLAAQRPGSLSSDQIRAEPKVELHRHLELCFAEHTILEFAQAEGLPSRLEDWLILEPMRDLASVLVKFVSIQKLLTSPARIRRWAEEALWMAQDEGVALVEFRYAPTFIQGVDPIRPQPGRLSFDEIHHAVEEGFKRAHAAGCQTEVGLLLTVQRIQPDSVNRPLVSWILTEMKRPGSLLVGVDLADDEMASPPARFGELFSPLRKAGVPITIHAGEARFAGAAQNVIDAVTQLGARRIGHGLQIAPAQGVKLAELAVQTVRDTGVALELCPTSNWLTQAIGKPETHPLRQLDQLGVAVTLNSDDPGIFGIDLCHEWDFAHRALGCSLAELRRYQSTALDRSFVSDSTKAKVRSRFAQLSNE
jgi:adenosine deaminase